MALILVDRLACITRTLSRLKFRQIYHQLFHRLPNLLPKSEPELEPNQWKGYRGKTRFPLRWVGRKISFLEGEFHFVGKGHQFHGLPDWQYLGNGGLWLDHLHYLRYMETLGERLDQEQLNDWCHFLEDWYHKNSWGKGKAFLPPYNASERAFVIGRILCLNYNSLSSDQKELHEKVFQRDLAYVARNLEFHLDGNHLLKNLLSLLWGITLFSGKEVQVWKKLVDRYLPDALEEQILSDGMHYERSPSYHDLALVDILYIINVLPESNPWVEKLKEIAERMVGVSLMLRHPNGQTALFNDGSLDLGTDTQSLFEAAEVLIGSVSIPRKLPEAGYYILTQGEKYYAIADAGNMAPDHQMGHAHADIFSFELSINGSNVIIDTGTSTYHEQPFRDIERSTAAHNTVEISGTSQAEMWSYFRVGRRGKPREVGFRIKNGQIRLSGWHDGYKHLSGNPVHFRDFQFSEQNGLEITDRVDGCVNLPICSRLHLAEDVEIESLDDNITILRLPDGEKVVVTAEGGTLLSRQGWCAKKFSERVSNHVLSLNGVVGGSPMKWRIYLDSEC